MSTKNVWRRFARESGATGWERWLGTFHGTIVRSHADQYTYDVAESPSHPKSFHKRGTVKSLNGAKRAANRLLRRLAAGGPGRLRVARGARPMKQVFHYTSEVTGKAPVRFIRATGTLAAGAAHSFAKKVGNANVQLWPTHERGIYRAAWFDSCKDVFREATLTILEELDPPPREQSPALLPSRDAIAQATRETMALARARTARRVPGANLLESSPREWPLPEWADQPDYGKLAWEDDD